MVGSKRRNASFVWWICSGLWAITSVATLIEPHPTTAGVVFAWTIPPTYALFAFNANRRFKRAEDSKRTS